MSLTNKIDFVALVSVANANPNGDPLNGNRPRTDYDDIGEISDVCIKRKIRNRLQDLGCKVFVQSADNTNDGFKCLSERAKSIGLEKSSDAYAKKACAEWIDVRSFGQVFALKGNNSSEGVSIGIRGPVSIQISPSVDPVDVVSMQITKSVSTEDGSKKGSDTMGTKHFVRYGLYVIKGAINVQLAEKTGFSDKDAELIKTCLATLFDNDASSARPEGSMVVNKLYWFKHNCKDGQYPSYKVHNSVKVAKNEGVIVPKSYADYIVTREDLPGLKCEEIEGRLRNSALSLLSQTMGAHSH